MRDCSETFSAAIFAAFAAALLGVCCQAHAQQVTVATGPTRNAVSAGPVAAIGDGPAWVFPASDPSVATSPRWLPETTVAMDAQRVYAISVQTSGPNAEPARLWAVRRFDGIKAWSVELPGLVFDSWSSPTLDPRNGSVLLGAGRLGPLGGLLIALDAQTGSVLWQTMLERDVVNASVVVTDDLGSANRAFITDYEGFYFGGTGAAVYCINIDPFDATENPFVPGEIVWKFDLFDGASGASPSYLNGRVFVATTGDVFAGTGGKVLCLDARATAASQALIWETNVGGDDGFFGGLSVVAGRRQIGDAVYGATYDFYGGGRSSRLIKLSAHDGAIHWQIPSDRTSTIPVVLRDGRILLSAGLSGFGSVPRLILYRDEGNQAIEVWDTALDTWIDANGNDVLDPGEFLNVGGWSYQPSVRHERDRSLVVVGGEGSSGQSVLRVIDLDRYPTQEGFEVSVHVGHGGSPGIGYRALYTIGPEGIAAFGLPIWPDVNGDGIADIEDLYAWQQGGGNRDVNLDGVVDASDATALETYLRRNEAWNMQVGRR